MKVLAVVPTKDGGELLAGTLASLLRQRVRVVVVDDDSGEETKSIISRFSPRVEVITLCHGEPRDFRRVPRLVNMALCERKNEKYLMISGDDCVYPENYVSYLVDRFEEDPRLVVASGNVQGGRYASSVPQGSGRVIRLSYLDRIGGRFLENIAWEGYVLMKALQLGYRIACYGDARFEHKRPYGGQSLTTFGHSAYMLGYPLVFQLARLVKNVLRQDAGFGRIGAFNIFKGHLRHFMRGMPVVEDDPLREFVYYTQLRRILVPKRPVQTVRRALGCRF